jgi:hypothetical protein
MARPHFKFWLDTEKPDELWLLEQIPILKRNNLFSRFIRDGLTFCIQLQEFKLDVATVYHLLADLRHGNTETLFVLFPHLKPTFERVGGNGFIGLGEAGAPASSFALPDLPQAVIEEAHPDLESMGEEFLDFIS